MGLVYFDARFEVCGAIVENEGGLSIAFDLGYTEYERKRYTRTILQDLVQPIAFPDDGSSKGKLPEPVVTPIQIPRSALRTKLMVSITDKHGSKLSTVEVYVHPHLTATTRPSGKKG